MMMDDETANMSDIDEGEEVPTTITQNNRTNRVASGGKSPKRGARTYPRVLPVSGERMVNGIYPTKGANVISASQSNKSKCFVSKWGILFILFLSGCITGVVLLTVFSEAPCSDPVTLFGKQYNPHKTTKIELSLIMLDDEEDVVVSEIPTELALMTKLTHLDLSSNPFKGTIPTDVLTSLSDLKYLNLGDCLYLEGSIPTQLSQLTRLEYLELAINALTGTLPSALASLTKLTYMDLMSNQLEGTIPADWGTSLTQLTHLSLLDNQLEGSLPTSFAALSKNLKFLFLSHNSALTGSVPLDFCERDTFVRIDCGHMTCSCCHSGDIGAPRCPNFLYNTGGRNSEQRDPNWEYNTGD